MVKINKTMMQYIKDLAKRINEITPVDAVEGEKLNMENYALECLKEAIYDLDASILKSFKTRIEDSLYASRPRDFQDAGEKILDELDGLGNYINIKAREHSLKETVYKTDDALASGNLHDYNYYSNEYTSQIFKNCHKNIDNINNHFVLRDSKKDYYIDGIPLYNIPSDFAKDLSILTFTKYEPAALRQSEHNKIIDWLKNAKGITSEQKKLMVRNYVKNIEIVDKKIQSLQIWDSDEVSYYKLDETGNIKSLEVKTIQEAVLKENKRKAREEALNAGLISPRSMNELTAAIVNLNQKANERNLPKPTAEHLSKAFEPYFKDGIRNLTVEETFEAYKNAYDIAKQEAEYTKENKYNFVAEYTPGDWKTEEMGNNTSLDVVIE